MTHDGQTARVFTVLGESSHTSPTVVLGDESGSQCWKDAEYMAERVGGKIDTFGTNFQETDQGQRHSFTVEVPGSVCQYRRKGSRSR